MLPTTPSSQDQAPKWLSELASPLLGLGLPEQAMGWLLFRFKIIDNR